MMDRNTNILDQLLDLTNESSAIKISLPEVKYSEDEKKNYMKLNHKYWSEIKKGLERIFDNDGKGRLSKQEYVQMYTSVYNCCTMVHKRSSYYFNQLKLHRRLKKYFNAHILNLFLAEDKVDLRDESLLAHYAAAWTNFQRGAKTTNNISQFLNQDLAKINELVQQLRKLEKLKELVRELKEQEKRGEAQVGDESDLNQQALVLWKKIFFRKEKREFGEQEGGEPTVIETSAYQIALVMWKKFYLSDLVEKINSAVFKMIERDRNGDKVDVRLINVTVSSMIELDSADPFNRLRIFDDHFKTSFLIETRQYYESKLSPLIYHNSMPEYIESVHQVLLSEHFRSTVFFQSCGREAEQIRKEISRSLLRPLVTSKRSYILLEFQRSLDVHNIQLLRMIYALDPEDISDLRVPMRDYFESHVKEKGLDAVAAYANDSESDDPEFYLDVISRIYNMYNYLVTASFENDKLFKTALDAACEDFINDNAATKGDRAKSSELFAKYFDVVLNKNRRYMGEEDLENLKSQSTNLFKFIRNKDAFQTFYSRLLAKRLMGNVSVGIDDELSVISKLREICGLEYTSTLMKMIQDNKLSKEWNQKFKNLMFEEKSLDIEFNAQILSKEHWSLHQSLTFSLPAELEKCLIHYSDFYTTNIHKSKKLHWYYNYSRGEIQSYCYNRPYKFLASTMQMCVLLQYNTSKVMTLRDLQENTGTPINYLIQVVDTLLKANLLNCGDGKDKLNAYSIVKLARGYENKKLKVDINVSIKLDSELDKKSTDKHLELHRQSIIQAAIVRIMKTRKVLSDQSLKAEVFSQLSVKFKPEISEINTNIDLLIKKEYLSPCEEQPDTFKYLA